MNEYQADKEYRAAIRKLIADSEGTLQKALNYLYDLRHNLTQAQSRIAVLEQELSETRAAKALLSKELMRLAGECCGYEDSDGCDWCHPLRVALATTSSVSSPSDP